MQNCIYELQILAIFKFLAYNYNRREREQPAQEHTMTDTIKDERFWDRVSRKYAASNIDDLAGYERSLERIASYLRAEDQVLEIGCGTGTTAIHLAPGTGHILATDFSNRMLELARKKADAAKIGNVTFEKAQAGAPRFEGYEFDAVLACNVLHLVPELDAALGRLRTSLKPGGLLISKTPCLQDMNPLIRWIMLPFMRAMGRAPYVNSLTATSLEMAIENAGFEIIERGYHGSKSKDARPFLVAKRG